MADGFVQKNAGPARSEHHGHFASRGRARLQIGECCANRLVDVLGDHGVVKIGQAEAAATAGGAAFAPAFLFGNHRDRQAHQGPHIGSEHAIGARHHDHVVFHGQAGHDLHHARVFGAGQGLYLAQEGDFGRAVQCGDGVSRAVQRAAAGNLLGTDFAAGAGAGQSDGAHGARCVQQRGFGNVIRIRECGFFAADSAHAHTLVDAEAAGFDNAFFQTPTFGAGVLEIQVGFVDAVGFDFGQHPPEVGFV